MSKFTIEELEKIISEAPEDAEFYTPGYDAEYRKTKGGVYYCLVGNTWIRTCDTSLSIERISEGFKLTDLQKQLDEMKMQESQEMQVEMENTAQQVESLAKKMTAKEFLDSGRKFHAGDKVSGVNYENFEITKPEVFNRSGVGDSEVFVISAKELTQSALTMSERDIEDALEPEWKNGDDVIFDLDRAGVFIGYIPENASICVIHQESFSRIHYVKVGELSKPLTPEQKQQKIDEQNGKSYYRLICKVESDNEVCGLNNPWGELKDKWQKIYIDIAKQIDFKGKLESI